ncbi:hypothetical protein OAP25_02080 [Flavobacteriaceae bacterium]|nr:hypothetical protein [Flavobacteriaceae bacterium]
MSDLSEDRKAELTNAIENITQDAHNKAISDCHHLVLGLFDDAEGTAKELYCELEKKVVELYKQ